MNKFNKIISYTNIQFNEIDNILTESDNQDIINKLEEAKKNAVESNPKEASKLESFYNRSISIIKSLLSTGIKVAAISSIVYYLINYKSINTDIKNHGFNETAKKIFNTLKEALFNYKDTRKRGLEEIHNAAYKELYAAGNKATGSEIGLYGEPREIKSFGENILDNILNRDFDKVKESRNQLKQENNELSNRIQVISGLIKAPLAKEDYIKKQEEELSKLKAQQEINKHKYGLINRLLRINEEK